MGDGSSKAAGAAGGLPAHPGHTAHIGTGLAGAVAAGVLARRAHDHTAEATKEAQEARAAGEAKLGLEVPKTFNPPKASAASAPPQKPPERPPEKKPPPTPLRAPSAAKAKAPGPAAAAAPTAGRAEGQGEGKGRSKSERKKAARGQDAPEKGEAAARGEKQKVGKDGKETPREAPKGGRPGGKGGGPSAAPSGPFGSGNGFRLNVKNLTSDTTGDGLKMLFRPFGNVILSQVKAREDGKSRGFGFVVFATEAEAKAAIDGMNNKDVGSKKLLSVIPAERRASDDGLGDAADLDARGKGKGRRSMESVVGQAAPQDFAALPSSSQDAAQAQPLLMMQQQVAYMQQVAYWQHTQQQAQAQQAQQQLQLQMQQHVLQAQAGACSPPGTWAGQSASNPFGLYGYCAPAAASSLSLQVASGDAGAGAGPPEYEGSLKSISERNGYGFIVCAATFKLYGRDVYIDRELLPEGAKVACRLRFTVTTTVKGEGSARPKAATAALVKL